MLLIITYHIYFYLFLITGDTYNLFAFPSECNFSGLRFNLDLVNFMKEDLSEMFESSTHHRYSSYNWIASNVTSFLT